MFVIVASDAYSAEHRLTNAVNFSREMFNVSPLSLLLASEYSFLKQPNLLLVYG